MDASRPKSSTSSGQEKKTQFDDLSREALITKCKNLLVIAKKAKASKDEALDEIKRLKQEGCKESDENSLETMKEIVENLTENKLADANKIEALSKQLSDKEKQLTRFNETEIENEALKRQLQRLCDENDSLLAQMESFENKPVDDDHSETKIELMKQIESLNKQILSFEKQFELKSQESKSLQDLIDHNSTKIKGLIQENSDLKDSFESQSDTIPTTDQVKIKYDKCVKKLKLYREKIYEISENLKTLKADREVLLGTAKEYSLSISKWQQDIAIASLKMIERIRDSNKQLRLKQDEIDMLRKDISCLKSQNHAVNEITEKDLKQEIETLKEEVKARDKSLEEEREVQKKLKQAAKRTISDLEMEAYEKTLDEVNKKLEAKNMHINEVENTIKIQNEMMESFKSQISSLEANLESEKLHSIEVKKNLDSNQNLLRKTEHERTEANLQLELFHKNLETVKLENTEIKLEMSKDYGNLEKRYVAVESERDDNLKNISLLECEVEKYKKLSSTQEKEIEDLRSDFAGYKLRATSVLRQSQTKDFSKEQELQDEVTTLQKTLEIVKNSNNKLVLDFENLKKSHNDLVKDKTCLQGRCKELIEKMERHSEEVLEESRKRNQQHDESTKAYQLQIDTLNAFYKKKLQESEDTISDLCEKISNLEKKLTLPSLQLSSAFDSSIFQIRNEDHKSNIMIDREEALLTRTEAEGSEDQLSSYSQSSTFQIQRRKSSKSTLMPLEELLNSSFDDNLNEITEDLFSNEELLEQTKIKLVKEENRVGHLTTLLGDSEKDLARMEQFNEMLKEEIRRLQRNVDREEHIQNSEYLKNIVIKFVTLSNGDEKQRLLPVLNTILKLSSEENVLLQNACKGGWSGLWTK